MKLICKLEDGALLVGMSQAQFDALAIIAGFYDGTLMTLSPDGPGTPPAASPGAGQPGRSDSGVVTAAHGPHPLADGGQALPPIRARPARRTPIHQGKRTPRSIEVRCKQCNELFARPQGSHRQCCSDTCLKAYNREYARKAYRQKHQIPADAPLMDAQARRLEMIKASVARANAAKEG